MATCTGRIFAGQGGCLTVSGWFVPPFLFCPKCGLCVSPSIPVSGQVPWGLIGYLGLGQAHPGVSIETADPGCEFLVLENPVWWL